MTAPSDRRGSAVVVDIANGTRVTRPTRPIPISARPRPTSEIASDPQKLLRYLSDLEAHIAELAALTASNMFGSGVLIRNIAMVAGVSQLVEHRLRRDYIGYVVTRYLGAAGDYPAFPISLALPTGRDASQWIYLQTERDCTLDVFVF